MCAAGTCGGGLANQEMSAFGRANELALRASRDRPAFKDTVAVLVHDEDEA
jgi:hypothetical protein